jgi:tripartite ATP-independent transporter DctM subunit
MIAGVVPGIAIAIAMAIINHAVSTRRDYRGIVEALTARDYLRNTWRALPALVLPVLILGGIASGAFTPTEASVVAVFYALAAGRWIYRSLEWRMLPGILSRSALMTASVLIIVAMSGAFAWVLTVSRVPQELTAWIVGMNLSPLAFLFAVNVLLLVFGIFIEPLPGVVVLVPILAPIAHALGINDLQFGIIVIVNLTMGMITPPVGWPAFRHVGCGARAAVPPRRGAVAVHGSAGRRARAADRGARFEHVPAGVFGYR